MHVAAARIHGIGDLRWFCEEGQAAFERSTMGAMLARQDLYGHSYLGRDARGAVLFEKLKRNGQEITARPTVPAREASGHVAADEDLDRYARVSRVLEAVSARAPTLAAAIRAPFSDAGATFRWLGGPLASRAGRRAPGDMLVLYALVPSGQQLIQEATNALEQQHERAAAAMPRRPKGAARAARRAARRLGLATAPASAVGPHEDREAVVPWEHIYGDGVSVLTERPRVVSRLAPADRASARPSSLQLANEMLAHRRDRLALQAAAELESIELFAHAVASWNTTWEALGYCPKCGNVGDEVAPGAFHCVECNIHYPEA